MKRLIKNSIEIECIKFKIYNCYINDNRLQRDTRTWGFKRKKTPIPFLTRTQTKIKRFHLKKLMHQLIIKIKVLRVNQYALSPKKIK